MTFTALDSALLGPLFATDAMRACFSDQARLAAMLAVEAALARAEASLGLVPDALGPALAAIDPAGLNPVALGRKTAVAGVPTIPFVKAVQVLLPPELERGFHKGATTQDVLDTALVLQLRDALQIGGSRNHGHPGGASEPGQTTPRHPVRRAHLRPARRSADLRLQGSGLVGGRRRSGAGSCRNCAPACCAHRWPGRWARSPG